MYRKIKNNKYKQERNIVEGVRLTIKGYLPKTYFIPKVKLYSNNYSMVRAEGLQNGKTYIEQIAFYRNYLKQHGKEYIDSKYYKSDINTNGVLCALSGDKYFPIKLNYNEIKKLEIRELLFLLLHEIGHLYYQNKRKMKTCHYNEREADMFAIRWTKRIIKRNPDKIKKIKGEKHEKGK